MHHLLFRVACFSHVFSLFVLAYFHISFLTVATTLDPRNLTEICANISSQNVSLDWWSNVLGEECIMYGGKTLGDGCYPKHYVSDVFFLSILLFLGTFGVAVVLKVIDTGLDQHNYWT